MNFTVTDLKKKSIKWQILKCHDFSSCSAQKPIWKCQHPSPHQPCEPGWLPRLWQIPGRIPVCFGFLREAPSWTSRFLHEDISLASVSEWCLGLCPKYQEGAGGFLAVLLMAGPPALVADVVPASGLCLSQTELDQPAAQGALGAASSNEERWVAQSLYQQ